MSKTGEGTGEGNTPAPVVSPGSAAPGATKKLKKSGVSFGGALVGIVGGLVAGGTLAAVVVLLVKHRKKVVQLFNPSPGDQPATQERPATVVKFAEKKAS